MEFPTRSGTWTLPPEKRREYWESYPGLDLESELRRARQWLRDNPKRRKTDRGMPRFLTNWLNRAGEVTKVEELAEFDFEGLEGDG